MTFDEWYQAWLRLLELLTQYMSHEFHLWQAHVQRILSAVTRSDQWSLWVAYDVQVRQQSILVALDLSIFHPAIWNKLSSTFLQNTALQAIMILSGRTDLQISPLVHPAFPTDRPMGLSFPPLYANSITLSYRSQHLGEPRTGSNAIWSHPMTGWCFFCGGTDHTSLSCNATSLPNGWDLHVKLHHAGDKRCDSAGNFYCFRFNSLKGCPSSDPCDHGKHWCTLCGNSSHSAQSCPSI